MTCVLACVSLLALTVLVQFYAVRGNIFKQQKDGEPPKGCLLQAKMRLEYCLTPAEAEEFRDTMYNKLSHLKSVRLAMPVPDDLSTDLSKPEHGEEVRVENGAVCMVNPNSGDASVYTCKQGSWMAFKAFMVSDNTVLFRELGKSRKKRLTTVPVTVNKRRQVCTSVWFWKSCKWEDYTEVINNGVPEVSCPNIPNYVAPSGSTHAYVKWSPATATDHEDGEISTRQTRGPGPRTFVRAGTYTVTYEAIDSYGTAAYCSTTFTVNVNRYVTNPMEWSTTTPV